MQNLDWAWLFPKLAKPAPPTITNKASFTQVVFKRSYIPWVLSSLAVGTVDHTACILLSFY